MNSRDKATGRFMPNENRWSIENEIAYCFSNGKLLFFTDADKYQQLKDMHFSKHADGYSATRINGVEVGVHRILTEAQSGDIVDHINRNKKDNRQCNLRITDKSGNAFNSKTRSTNSSGRTGVWYRKDTKKWCAEIKVNNKKIVLGCFELKEDAIEAREKAEADFYGYQLQN